MYETRRGRRPATMGGVVYRSLWAVAFGVMLFVNVRHGGRIVLVVLDAVCLTAWGWWAHRMYRRVKTPHPPGVTGDDVRK